MRPIQDLMAALLESLTAEIRKAGKEDDYCAITIYPGTGVPVDFGPESGCRGTAWVRLVSANPSISFPSADNGLNNCAYSLAYTVELGMVGPAPVMEDRLGNFIVPDDVEQFEASMRMLGELEIMHAALRNADIDQMVVGDWSPQGPEGGVMGGLWTAQIGGDED